MKIALVAFEGEVMCFAHVLLNAIDMESKGHEVAVIIEGAACKLIPQFDSPDTPFSKQYNEVRSKGLIRAVCKACASKMESLEAAEKQGLPIDGTMSGHPALCDYISNGFQIITF